MNRRISIKKPVKDSDEYGDWTSTTYEEIRNCYANVSFKSGTEKFGNDQFTNIYYFKVTVRFFKNSDFNETCIVEFDDTVYNIISIDRRQHYDEIVMIVKRTD